MSYIGPAQIVRTTNAIMDILGTTKASFWPFYEKAGILVSGVGVGDLIPSETAAAAEALEDDFSPLLHPGGNYSYHFHPTGDHHLAGIDSAAYTFGDSADDLPFSVGAWICPNVVTAGCIISKYSATVREWQLTIGAGGLLTFELYDESADTTEIGVTIATLTAGKWVHVVAAYDGTQTAPVVTFYLNGAANGLTTTAETGAYVATEDTATPLLIGCSGVTAGPVNEFHGRIALPFVTGKCLTAAEVKALYDITTGMMGT